MGDTEQRLPDHLSRWEGAQHHISFNCGQPSAVGAQEVARRCMLRYEITKPLLIAPEGTADIEHALSPLPSL